LDGTLVDLDVDWEGYKKERGNRDVMKCLDLRERFELENIDNIGVRERVVNIARGLCDKKLAIFSRNTHKTISTAIKDMGIKFDMIISINDVEKPKPDPEGLELILNKTNVKKEKALFIGDSDIDRIAGERAGIKTLMVNEI